MGVLHLIFGVVKGEKCFLAGATFDPARAQEWASNIGGVVVPCTLSADYRPEVVSARGKQAEPGA